MIKQAFISTAWLLTAIFLGLAASTYGTLSDWFTSNIDYLVIALVVLVLADTPLTQLIKALKKPKFIALAWGINFFVLPILGFALTWLLLPKQPLLALGLAIYFMAPCTDWFLGFTRMAGGNTALGSVLLPINMLTQLILYPFYLWLFIGVLPVSATSVLANNAVIHSMDVWAMLHSLLQWFVLPLMIAFAIKLISRQLPWLGTRLHYAVSGILLVVIMAVFAIHGHSIVDNVVWLKQIIVTVLVFFVLSFATSEFIARQLRLNLDNHILLTMTTTARNAPLILGLTMSALPNQPLIYSAIIIAMLIEFPLLTLHVLRFRHQASLNQSPIEKTPSRYAVAHLSKANH